MAVRTAIGITTYLDISAPLVGQKVYEAYAAASAEIVPNQVFIWSEKHAVNNADDFSRLWLTPLPFKMTDEESGALLESGEHQVGAEWRRVRAIPGQGSVEFRGKDRTKPDTIIIDHKYSAKIDWRAFFESLIDLTNPAYAMLHLFTDAEVAKPQSANPLERFDQPIAGEEYFTSWKTSLGHWRRPDPWQLTERRQYRFLPELSWANYLGPEFAGEYDLRLLQERAARVREYDRGLLFEVSDALDDVQSKFDEFDLRRAGLREAFRPGFFRGSGMQLL